MDTLLALATIAIVIIRLIKKTQKNAAQNSTEPEEIKVNTYSEPKAEPTAKVDFERTTRSTEYNRDKLGAKIKNESNIRPDFISSEGYGSQEGECIEPNANHCAVEHMEDTVYDTEIKDETVVDFNRENLVKGIVMAEILSKPKWKE
ncbi:MAG: hypothetical protein E7365_03470 [Clostridiales bacterium]|nr:hypothetical protein [Clostridiales bacterium]